MSESIMLPVIIRPYGEIGTMLDYQKFVKHYRELVELSAEQKKYIEALEANIYELTGGDAWDHLKPEHYKMLGST